jgi:DivIVA domain-containing protein
MDLTTELLDNAAFREAKRGGYNTQDVDEFIEQVKVEYGHHDALVREARQRIETAESRVAEAERRASEANERAMATSDADDTLKRTLVLAQRTADAAIKEAEEQASRTLSSAQDQAARMLADAQETTARARAEAESEARKAQEEARRRVLSELRDLEAARDQLHADVDTLERHLEEQRDRLRHSTRELQRLLDDPDALREVEVPVVSRVVVPSTPATALLAESAQQRPTADADRAAWMPDDVGEPDEPAAPGSSSVYAAEDPDEGVGPSTETIDLLSERDADDDAYLAELRKAMTDESPLGPRDEGDIGSLFDSGAESSRSRFGRRR